MSHALLFDYGGTLDTHGRHWARVLWEAYQEAGVACAEEDFREAYVSVERRLGRESIITPRDTFRDVLVCKVHLQMQLLGLGAVSSGMERLVVDYCDAYARRCTAQSADVLSRLHVHYPLVLVSNFYGNLRAVLSDYALLPLFDDIVESAAVGLRKPDPAIWRLAVERQHLAPAQCTVIGDSLKNDILPAHTLGIPTIWYQGQGWEHAETAPFPCPTIRQLDEIPRFCPR